MQDHHDRYSPAVEVCSREERLGPTPKEIRKKVGIYSQGKRRGGAVGG